MAYTTRLHMLKKTLHDHPSCKLLICERSLEADKHIFANMLHDDGIMEDVNYQIYQAYFSEYEDLFRLNGLIYVRADPSTCYERVCKRNRNGENTIEQDYLKKCHDYHENWLMKNNELPSLVLDVNKHIHFDEKNQDETMISWMKQVDEFIQKIN